VPHRAGVIDDLVSGVSAEKVSGCTKRSADSVITTWTSSATLPSARAYPVLTAGTQQTPPETPTVDFHMGDFTQGGERSRIDVYARRTKVFVGKL